jgi:TIR domain
MSRSPFAPRSDSAGGDAARRIFISYRRDDTRHIAGRLSDRLEERFPHTSVFMDVDTLDPGVDFFASIQEAVGQCDVLVAIIGPRWLSIKDRHGHRRIDCPEDWVSLEIATALERRIPVIPVLVDEIAMPSQDELPERLKPLARRNAARLDHETFKTDIERIVTAIERATIRPRRPEVRGPTPPQTLKSNPARITTDTSTRRPTTPPPASASPPFTPAPRQRPLPGQPFSHLDPIAAWPSSTPRLPATKPTAGHIPLHRSALRIGLWWVIGFLALFICFGTTSEIVRPSGNTTGAALALVLMGGLAAIFILGLRREIGAQRRLLDRAGVGQDSPARRPLTFKHIRLVSVCLAGGIAVLALLLAISPPAPAPQPQAPGTPTSSAPASTVNQ